MGTRQWSASIPGVSQNLQATLGWEYGRLTPGKGIEHQEDNPHTVPTNQQAVPQQREPKGDDRRQVVVFKVEGQRYCKECQDWTDIECEEWHW